MDDTTAGTLPDAEANAQLSELKARVKQGMSAHREAFKSMRKNRKAISGKKSAQKTQRTKLIYSTLQGLVPHVFAQNPELSASPSEAADLSRDPWVKQFAHTLQVVVNQQLRSAGLKRIAKRCVRSAYASKVGWAKVGYQRDVRDDPITLEGINDAQDNINDLQALCTTCEDDERADMEAEIARIEQTRAALEGEVEVTVSEGLTLDYIPATYLLIDPTIECLEDYRQAGWMDQTIYMPPSKVKSMFKVKLEGFTEYNVNNRDRDEHEPSQSTASSVRDEADDGNRLVAVHEHWDHRTMHVYTWAEGHDQWLREPYAPTTLGEQWFPYFPLILLKSEGQWWPTDLVELLEELVDEYNELRDDKANHRKTNVPGYVASAEMVKPQDIKRFQTAEHGEVTTMPTGGKRPEDVMSPKRLAPMSPAQYDASDIHSDIEQMSGLQDAARGSVTTAKTATEAEILQRGLVGRTGSNQDDVEDWILDMALYGVAVLLQQLSAEQVERIAGPGGGAVWPMLKKEEAYDLTDLDIRAGSAGKPNKQREQEQWINVAPIIGQLIDKMRSLVFEMQMSPQPEIEQLKETLRRFDERIDVEQYIPPEVAAFIKQTGGGDGSEGAQPGVGAVDPATGQPLPPGPGNVLPFNPQQGVA